MISDLIPSEDGAVLGLVGTAKNSGKTTVLNWILEQLSNQNRCAGLVSIGFDGETRDFWLGVAKPAVHVSKGTWIASAERSLSTGTAPITIHKRTGIKTPLGEVVIAKATAAGTTVLAGMRHRRDVINVCKQLQQAGADITIVDGAYHRRALAHPALTDSIIVATGAVLAGTPNRVASDTANAIAQLSLEAVASPEEKRLLAQAIAEKSPMRQNRDETIQPLDCGALQLDASNGKERLGDAKYLAVPGVASDALVDALCACESPPTLLLPNATHLVLKNKTWTRLKSLGGRVLVGQTIRIRAITVNPCGIRHDDHDPIALLEAVKRHCPTIPVYNVIDP